MLSAQYQEETADGQLVAQKPLPPSNPPSGIGESQKEGYQEYRGRFSHLFMSMPIPNHDPCHPASQFILLYFLNFHQRESCPKVFIH